jgi:hypothetical protein
MILFLYLVNPSCMYLALKPIPAVAGSIVIFILGLEMIRCIEFFKGQGSKIIHGGADYFR